MGWGTPKTTSAPDSPWATQDDCLIRMETGQKPDPYKMRQLPPWRAVLIARIGEHADIYTAEEVEAIVEEARRVGGQGRLVRAP